MTDIQKIVVPFLSDLGLVVIAVFAVVSIVTVSSIVVRLAVGGVRLMSHCFCERLCDCLGWLFSVRGHSSARDGLGNSLSLVLGNSIMVTLGDGGGLVLGDWRVIGRFGDGDCLVVDRNRVVVWSWSGDGLVVGVSRLIVVLGDSGSPSALSLCLGDRISEWGQSDGNFGSYSLGRLPAQVEVVTTGKGQRDIEES